MSDSVSLVIAVRNEQGTVEDLLRSVAAQTRRPDECIVVDDGSEDGTADRVEELRESGLLDLSLRRLSHRAGRTRAVSRARNVGIREASGEIVALADAGTVLDPDWLDQLIRPFADDPGLAVCGGLSRPGGKTWFQRCLATVITPQIQDVDPDRFLPIGRSMAFRKEWWKRVGGFPDWIGNCEDLLFDRAVQAAGGRLGFAPDAVCTWHPVQSLGAFFAKYFTYARGDGRGGLWAGRHLIRYASYLTGVVVLALAWRQPLAWALLALGFAAYGWKFHRRLNRFPPGEGILSAIASRAVMPVIMGTGDLAKMLGYPVGLLGRRRRAPVDPQPASSTNL